LGSHPRFVEALDAVGEGELGGIPLSCVQPEGGPGQPERRGQPPQCDGRVRTPEEDASQLGGQARLPAAPLGVVRACELGDDDRDQRGEQDEAEREPARVIGSPAAGG
jgi:hypothetical protein